MGLRKLLLGGLLALLGPAPAEDARAVTWQESAGEAESWARALNPPRPLATICGLCGRILGRDGVWRAPAAQPVHEELSHGFCPPCARQHHPDLFGDL